MKRHTALLKLSREHYGALKLARDGKIAALSGDLTAVAALAARVGEEFAGELEPHFREEETGLLPFLAAVGEASLVTRTLAEHGELRALGAALQQPDAATLHRFSALLAAHIRFEERTLFEAAQTHGFGTEAPSASAGKSPLQAENPSL
ncbi:MAG: hemerythrin domain-containing protein [Azospira sp.]|jgi:hypothetical protein|nr:hemerythrin domain-containing protein [Azospira sp.]